MVWAVSGGGGRRVVTPGPLRSCRCRAALPVRKRFAKQLLCEARGEGLLVNTPGKTMQPLLRSQRDHSRELALCNPQVPSAPR